MDYDVLKFHSQSTKMSNTNCLILPSTTITTSTQSAFKLGEAATNDFLQPSVPYSNVQLYSTYAENFDLSLLPQDIPTTVYQYTNETSTNNKATTTRLTTPDIKIQQGWLQNDEVKQELKHENFLPYTDQVEGHYHSPGSQNKTQNSEQAQQKTVQLLIPPPAYPHVYPSPQSSPAQSECCFPQSQFSGAYDSLSSSRTSLYASSPCPSVDAQSIKQELHILPPSPPESSCEVLSPDIEIKTEPLDNDVDFLVTDLNSLVTKQEKIKEHKNNQLLCEYLQDISFQKKHNIKPLALESFIGDLEAVRGDIESVISLALQHAKREADETCRQLQISHDPRMWTPAQVHAWLRSTITQFKLPLIENLADKFHEDGAALLQLSEEEFASRVPESGNTLHAQLEIWNLACSDSYENNFSTTDRPEDTQFSILSSKKDALQKQQQEHQQLSDVMWQESADCLPNFNITMNKDNSEEEEEMLPSAEVNDVPMSVSSTTATNVATVEVKHTSSAPTGRTGGSHIHLWQFLKELLSTPHVNGTAIRWIDRSTGIFKIEDSVRVAKLWGRRKNRPAMNYDKLSRSIRQYYKKGIMKKTERSQRLVYQFCHPYHL